MHNDVDGIKWKYYKFYLKDRMADRMKKSIEKIIRYVVKESKLLPIEISHILTLR